MTKKELELVRQSIRTNNYTKQTKKLYEELLEARKTMSPMVYEWDLRHALNVELLDPENEEFFLLKLK